MKSDFLEIDEKLIKLRQEVKSAVKKTDFDVLAKYIDLWQPMSFLTMEDAQKMLDNK